MRPKNCDINRLSRCAAANKSAILFVEYFTMWGANKWTDSMFKKYWRAVTVLILLYLLSRIRF